MEKERFIDENREVKSVLKFLAVILEPVYENPSKILLGSPYR